MSGDTVHVSGDAVHVSGDTVHVSGDIDTLATRTYQPKHAGRSNSRHIDFE